MLRDESVWRNQAVYVRKGQMHTLPMIYELEQIQNRKGWES
jgi:hypothetical protein